VLLRIRTAYFQAGTAVVDLAQPADRLMIVVSGRSFLTAAESVSSLSYAAGSALSCDHQALSCQNSKPDDRHVGQVPPGRAGSGWQNQHTGGRKRERCHVEMALGRALGMEGTLLRLRRPSNEL
jgi:hypothetical protein